MEKGGTAQRIRTLYPNPDSTVAQTRNIYTVVIFYGANDGLFRAVKGGQNPTDGFEKWAFVPTEIFSKFKRLRDNLPAISPSNPKPYFADGAVESSWSTGLPAACCGKQDPWRPQYCRPARYSRRWPP